MSSFQPYNYRRKSEPLRGNPELLKSVEESLKREEHRLTREKLKATHVRRKLELFQERNENLDQELKEFIKSTARSSLPCNATSDSPPASVNMDHQYVPSSSTTECLLEKDLEGLHTKLKNIMERQNAVKLLETDQESVMKSALGKWVHDYNALYKEFFEYKSKAEATLQAEIASSKDQATLAEQEQSRVRSQLDKEKFELESTCRELIREKSSLHCEIRTLREELDETRLKLQEKTSQLDSLNRNTDHSFSLAKSECWVRTHMTLEDRLRAADSRNLILQQEIQDLVEANEQLRGEISNMTEQDTEKVSQFTKRIGGLEMCLTQERKSFDLKYNELTSVIQNQQACIIEIENSMKSREEESQTLMVGFQAYSRNLMTDSLNSVTALEKEKLDLIETQRKMNEELKDMKGQLENLNNEIKKHQGYAVKLCSEGLEILLTQNRDDFVSNGDKIDFKIRLDETSEIGNGNIHEESMLQKLLDAIVLSQQHFRQTIDQLHSRIQELNNGLKLEQVQHTMKIEESRKQLKMYAQIILKLEGQITKKTKINPISKGQGDCGKSSTILLNKTDNVNNVKTTLASFETFLDKLSPHDSVGESSL